MKKVVANELTDNFAKIIGQNWLLISAGDKDNFNTMTASWGFVGHYANRDCAIVFIRPERYTYEFVEEHDCFTLSFFSEDYKKTLAMLGSKSGRNSDKIAQSGLTPLFTENGNPSFEQAEIIIECRKIYGTMMDASAFIDKSILDKWYDESHGSLHKMYIAEIMNTWIKE